MRILKSYLVVATLGLAVSVLAQDAKTKEDEALPWQDAEKNVGKLITIEGRCLNTRRVPGAIHLDFHADFGSHFRVIIPQTSLAKFQSDPMLRYKERMLRVTGKVAVDRGVPFMKISDPKAIKIVPPKRKVT